MLNQLHFITADVSNVEDGLPIALEVHHTNMSAHDALELTRKAYETPMTLEEMRETLGEDRSDEDLRTSMNVFMERIKVAKVQSVNLDELEAFLLGVGFKEPDTLRTHIIPALKRFAEAYEDGDIGKYMFMADAYRVAELIGMLGGLDEMPAFLAGIPEDEWPMDDDTPNTLDPNIN